MSSVVAIRQSMRFKARSFMAFALAPDRPIVDWLAELDNWILNSADFFVGRPVVLDLAAVKLSGHAIKHLISELETRGVRIMGIEGADPSELGPNLPPLLKGGRPASADALDSPPSKQRKPLFELLPDQEPTSLLLDAPVRSGQSVVFPGGDVTVTGAVASGAEIVAGGSIHVYGAIRGRAMAGANGNAQARIFCSKAEPELLAINGYYLTAEDMDAALRGRPVQAWLDGETIKIAAQG